MALANVVEVEIHPHIHIFNIINFIFVGLIFLALILCIIMLIKNIRSKEK